MNNQVSSVRQCQQSDKRQNNESAIFVSMTAIKCYSNMKTAAAIKIQLQTNKTEID